MGVHSQQINEFDLLKRFTRALALGGLHSKDVDIDEEIRKEKGLAKKDNNKNKVTMKHWVDEQLHTPLLKDIAQLS